MLEVLPKVELQPESQPDLQPWSEAAMRVRRMLYDRGSTLVWLARQSGFSAIYVRYILTDRRPFTEEIAARFARALGVPADVLFAGIDFRERKGWYRKRKEDAA